MPNEFPCLSGVATKDLVEQIGSGSFKASYINWSRTMELLRKHAPGWLPELVWTTQVGDALPTVLHQSPVGGYLLIRFRHIDGTVTPEVPQAVMDNRNFSIPYEKITARDITDTHRRGTCLAACLVFGLAYELWAKMPLESGYGDIGSAAVESTTTKKSVKPDPAPTEPEVSSTDSKTEFINLATKMGLCDPAIQDLMSKIKGDFSTGIKTLNSKNKDFVEQMNEKFLASQY